MVNGDYPRNSQGQTYGNTCGYKLAGYEPDLAAAVGTQGEEGYIATKDNGIRWSSDPELNAAYPNWRKEKNIKGWMIPL
ncbi:MAG: hypothetical protein HFF84_00015 [Oscillibacter sp.]|nr:hypothetical protein [Oscillibacter sp.]